MKGRTLAVLMALMVALVLVAGCGGGSSVATSGEVKGYSIVELPGTFSANALTDGNLIVGIEQIGSQTKAVAINYSDDPTKTIYLSGGDNAIPLVLANDKGLCASSRLISDQPANQVFEVAVWKTPSSLMAPANVGNGVIASEVLGINNQGDLLVGHYPASGPWDFYIWNNGTARQLNLGSGYGPDYINDSGQIAGTHDPNASAKSQTAVRSNSMTRLMNRSASRGGSGSSAEVFVLTNGVVSIVPTPGETYAYPFGITKNGAVAISATSGSSQNAYIWENSALTKIQPVFPGSQMQVAGINNLNLMVGSAQYDPATATYGNRFGLTAWVWNSGKTTDLNTMIPTSSGWTLFAAGCINNKGQIACSGVHNGIPASCILIPHS